MTDSDLATVREWCKANGVEIVESDPGEWGPREVPDYFGNSIWWFDSDSEISVYRQIWNYIRPWLASVRNLDAVEVEGPWKHDGSECGNELVLIRGPFGEDIFVKYEQTARQICNILNRECGDGR